MRFIKIFLASSSELKDDRDQFEIFIARRNKEWVRRGVFLDVVRWEDSLADVSKDRKQEDYNAIIRQCDIVVVLYFTKVGQYTQEEFDAALSAFAKSDRPRIFTFKKSGPVDLATLSIEDTQSLFAFDKKLKDLGHFYTVYASHGDLRSELGNQLDKLAASGFFEPGGAAPAAVPSACVDLLTTTLLKDVPDAQDHARRWVAALASTSGATERGLLEAVAYFIEHQLLTADDDELWPSGERVIDAALVRCLQAVAKAGAADAPPIDVASAFFGLAQNREEQWKQYFDALVEHGFMPHDAVQTLASIRVHAGFVTPQYLLAGLLSRFNEDWKKVLDVYQDAITAGEAIGRYESLRASQWMCWLMWGPSVPLCTCDQWRGLVAFQYGYGDENNSVPLLEVAGEGAAPAKILNHIGQQLCEEHRGSRFAAVTGRLRWGPWFLQAEQAAQAQEFDLAHRNRVTRVTHPPRLGVAAAQSALYEDGPLPNLVLQLERVDATDPETRVYYSAYLWMIFLVAVAPGHEKSAPGPALLRAKKYPEWPKNARQQKRVGDAHLWEDLLPVFVHANIGDPAALAFQKQVLVENAFQLLRQLWDQRERLFDAADVAAGLQFHLVCASDYSGCGASLRFPPKDTLLGLMKRRKASEPDAAFASAVVLPSDDETTSTRPWGLAGYFSACHLPKLIADYYDYIAGDR